MFYHCYCILTVVVEENATCDAKHGGQQSANCGQCRGPAPERPAVPAVHVEPTNTDAGHAAAANTAATDTSAHPCHVVWLLQLVLLLFTVTAPVCRFRDDGTTAAATTATSDTTAADATSVRVAPYARAVRFREHNYLVIKIGVVAVHINVTTATSVTVNAVRGHRTAIDSCATD